RSHHAISGIDEYVGERFAYLQLVIDDEGGVLPESRDVRRALCGVVPIYTRDRQHDGENCSSPDTALKCERSTVSRDNAETHGKSYAGARTEWLGGEVRFEDPLANSFGNTGSVVCYDDADRVGGPVETGPRRRRAGAGQ